jgi:hypothetical protein
MEEQMNPKDIPLGTTTEATHIQSGNPVTVYRRRSGGWVNYSDCKTVYQEEELDFG